MAKRSKKTPPRNRSLRPKRTLNCVFCVNDKVPDYKEFEDLKKFLSDRARIVGKNRTGICSKHQRMLGTSIKRARQLGLLPYVPNI